MEFTVNLGPRSYPVVLDQNVGNRFPARLKSLFPKSKFGLVTNRTLYALYEKQLTQWKRNLDLTLHVMPDGERYKTIKTWGAIFDTFLKEKFERSSVIIAFGGGVVGDMAGFAAASMLRGIAYVQVPTTLLAMVDSSVGGKTGLDHACGKNLIGAFHQPSLVWTDTDFLATLSKREYTAGYAELFKYAFIGGRDMFDFIAANHPKLVERDAGTLGEGIRRSIETKARIVEQDERETGGRRMLLNFGHTFAHALEKQFGYKTLLHGEAVWWGMACSCELGKHLKTIPASDAPAYEALLRLMPRPKLPGAPSIKDLYGAMLFDKKVSGGAIAFVVPAKPGTSMIKDDVPVEAVKEALEAVFSPPA
jgi:3-dehydroquinate synthase